MLGGTDLTIATADALLAIGLEVAGLVHVGQTFEISYSEQPVTNVRAVDCEGWCRAHEVRSFPYSGEETLESAVAETRPDVGLVVGWYHMVPASVRATVRKGFVGAHASLLPDLRGGAPLNWAILLERETTGVTLFELGDGVDDGPVYGQRSFDLGARTTVTELVRLAERATLELATECVPRILSGDARPIPQSGSSTYCLQRTPDDGRIEWAQSAEAIDRLVRAVTHPYPGGRTALDGDVLTVWDAEPVRGAPPVAGAPGQIARIPEVDAPCVVTGDGLIRLNAVEDADGESVMELLYHSANRRLDPGRIGP